MDKVTLFTTTFCTQCQTIKDMIKRNHLEDKFNFINVDDKPEYADEYNLVVVPALLDKDKKVVYCSDFSENQLKEFVKENTSE